MDSQNINVQVKLLNKLYTFRCPKHDKAALLEASRQLDTQLKTIAAQDNLRPQEHLLAMLAVNLMSEKLALLSHQQETLAKLDQLSEKIQQTSLDL